MEHDLEHQRAWARWADPRLEERLVELDACDGYVVLVWDPRTDHLDAHGPFDGLAATCAADRLRRWADPAGGGVDVEVSVARLHYPPPRTEWRPAGP